MPSISANVSSGSCNLIKFTLPRREDCKESTEEIEISSVGASPI